MLWPPYSLRQGWRLGAGGHEVWFATLEGVFGMSRWEKLLVSVAKPGCGGDKDLLVVSVSVTTSVWGQCRGWVPLTSRKGDGGGCNIGV